MTALLELTIVENGEHYRCEGCGEICLELTHNHVICMTQTEFDRFGGDPETCVWRHIDPETLNPGTCPSCRDGTMEEI